MKQLPNGWAIANISQVSTGCEQRAPQPNEVFNYVDIGSIDRHFKKIGPTQKVLGKSASSRARKRIQTNDVIVSMTRPNLNAVALVPPELDGQIASTAFEVLRANGVDPRWLFYSVRTKSFVDRMAELAQGALYPAVRSSQIRSYEIPIAPLEEQVRILTKLDNFFSRLEVSHDHLKTLSEKIISLRRSVLDAAFSGSLTKNWREKNQRRVDATSLANEINESHYLAGGHKVGNAAPPSDEVHDLRASVFPDDWALLTLRDIVRPNHPITYGILKPGPDLEEGVPYIKVMDFKNGEVDSSSIRRTSSKIHNEYKRSQLAEEDIILSIRGTVGRVAMVPTEFAGANITQDSARISVQPIVNRKFVLWYLRSQFAQSRLARATKGVAVRGVNIGDLRALQIPLPSRSEQDHIVDTVQGLIKTINELEQNINSAINKINNIAPVLLEKAFTGRLASQNASDESAIDLIAKLEMNMQPVKKVRRSSSNSSSQKENFDSLIESTGFDKVKMMNGISRTPDNYLTSLFLSSQLMSARQLWINSHLTIDEFYYQLSKEVSAGLLIVSEEDGSAVIAKIV